MEIVKIFVLLFVCSYMSCASAQQPLEIKVAYFSQEKNQPPPMSNLDPYIKDKGLPGAMLGIDDNNTTGKFTGQSYLLEKVIVPEGEDVIAAFNSKIKGHYSFVVTDVSIENLNQLKNQFQGMVVLDVSTIDDQLRSESCSVNFFHLLPSRAMRMDALAQYMLKKRWNKWFLVVGPTEEDKLYAQAAKRSAKRFGMKIVAEKAWEYTYDARRTAQAEVPEFTQVGDYDVLVVVDEQGLFGEYLDYRTWIPRPVIGTQGLIATAWHRTHEQWGAVQLQNRFKECAGRWMEEQDYGAYLAVRALGEAIARISSINPDTVKAYLLSDQFALQGYKGKPLSFRSWNGQLRQPILLAAPRSMVSVAPMEGFLHPTTELDTLGYDRTEIKCEQMSK